MKSDITVKPMTKFYFDRVEHKVKVTRIGEGWNVRIFTNNEVSQEMRVFDRSRIGVVAREMLRWEDKCGNFSDLSESARKRISKK